MTRTILEAADLKLIDVQMNGVNGGSFAVTAAPKASARPAQPGGDRLAAGPGGAHGPGHRAAVPRVRGAGAAPPRRPDPPAPGPGGGRQDGAGLRRLDQGQRPAAVLRRDREGAARHREVNPEKFGRVTPGTHIPIVSEAEAKAMNPDYSLVLPWHFKEGILQREQLYAARGGKFIFPFPEIEII
ncbi:MAG: hypothetical protein WDN45_17290 [Caulobacteraceae bacterium]